MSIDKFLDPQWRLESLYYIVDKKSNRKLFSPNTIQQRINKIDSKRKMILKSRQVGVSTNELLKQLDFVLFNKNVTACIMAHEQDAIEKLFRIPRRAYEFMNPALKPKIHKGGGSKYEMYFPEINSRIFCDLESRSNTINWLHISERAFIEDEDRILATIETVPFDTGIITIETTPKGMNSFYDEWMDTNTNYTKLFFPWYLHNEYKIKNHELTKSQLTDNELRLIDYARSKYQVEISLDQIAYRRFKQKDSKLFKQEYPEDDASCFLTSGENPFNLEIIKSLYDKAPEPIETINGIRIYKPKQQGRFYVLGADPAEGVGNDASAAHVFDVKTREQVASFEGQLKPSDFADKLIEMSDLYSGAHPCTIGVERNNHGHAVLLKLDEVHNYMNLFKATEDKLGWITDKVTRPLMIDTFIEGVENGTIKLNDRKTLGECLTLTNNNGKIEALDSKHDDLVISACIAVQMCIEESVLDVYSDVKSKILL